MIDSTKLKTELEQFIGTEQYYYNPLYPVMRYTDGVKCLAEQAQAYWLLDIIGTEFHPKQVTGDYPSFLVIKLIVKDSKANIVLEDGDYNPIIDKEIDFTDFPEGTWVLWLIDGVLILPSEY